VLLLRAKPDRALLLGGRGAGQRERAALGVPAHGPPIAGVDDRAAELELTGMPPALFSCGTLDPLLDDTLFMAARWQAAGNQAALAIYPGAPHEFLNLRDPISAEAQARERMIGFIEQVLTDDG
jgi:acetyl esterase/lipase